MKPDDGFLANAMPVVLTLAYFALMGWVIVTGGHST